MLKNLISLLNQRPDLAADYASNYAMLLRDAVLKAKRRYARRAIWLLMAVIFFNATVIVGALAAMLWVNQPALDSFNVILIPSVLGLCAVITGFLGLDDTDNHSELAQLNYQLQQDSKVFARLSETNEQV